MPIIRHAHVGPHIHTHFARVTRKDLDLTTGPFFSKIIRYTVPIILTSLLQLLFNAADLIVVGQTCGELYLGAVGATSSLIGLIVNFFIGLSIGAGVAIAQATGAEDEDTVRKTVHTAVLAGFLGGLLLTAVGLVGARTFLGWMGTPAKIIDLSVKYMTIYFFGTVPLLLYNYCAAILRAVGDTKSPFIFLSIAGVLNVGINLLFVLGFGMDVDGVAWATVISQTLACTLIVIKLMRRDDACRLQFRKLRIHKKPFFCILRIGIPAGLQYSLFAISNVLIQSSVNTFGEVVLSGRTAGGNIEGFVYVAMNAFQQTATNFIGQNVGAKKYGNVRKIVKLCMLCVVVTGIALGVLINLNAHAILSIYLTDAPEIAYEAGKTSLVCICLPYFLCGVMDVMTGTLRGMGKSLQPMLITVLGVCGTRITYIFTLFQLPQFHSLFGLLIFYPISWILTFCAELICYLVLRKRLEGEFAAPPKSPPHLRKPD